MNATQQLNQCVELLTQIHLVNHQISELKAKTNRRRVKWSQDEEDLLTFCVQMFGPNEYIKYSQVLGTKTKTQIYYHLRHMQENCLQE
ncbi:SANT/Myb_domain [Hexamita inflata]|uniref:SANT/Myb_domain n=1 Tax=Hexamita inflata TaxID=28002 RepID=A0ABP1HK89_9EUKA